MKPKFITCDRDTISFMPPSVQDWLPEKHLARFVVEIVEQLDLAALEQKYSYTGRKAYPVRVMLSLIFYGYITGVHASRKIEQATYDSVAFRFIAANHHPDHDTIATFRKTFLGDLKNVFVQILTIASEMGILKMGNVSTDGTKIKANASKHKALSWEYANKLEKQLKAEVEQLMKLAEEKDYTDKPEDMDIPEELSRRKNRLEVIAEAKKKIEQRANERFEKEKSEYEEKLAQREEYEKQTGKKKAGKQLQPPTPGPRKNDQINLTDEESRIMPKSGGGFEQAYNAQATVDIETMLIIANHVSQQTNDKLEIAPTIEKIKIIKKALDACEKSSANKSNEVAVDLEEMNLLADAGYFSKKNVALCKEANINPLIVDKRVQHNKSLLNRFEEAGDLPEDADAVTQMKYQLKTKEGKELYAKRKSTIEPVFGIIKNVMNFKAFLLRKLEAVIGEWNLVSIAWNIKRLFVLKA